MAAKKIQVVTSTAEIKPDLEIVSEQETETETTPSELSRLGQLQNETPEQLENTLKVELTETSLSEVLNQYNTQMLDAWGNRIEALNRGDVQAAIEFEKEYHTHAKKFHEVSKELFATPKTP